jgi:hypothetical protein
MQITVERTGAPSERLDLPVGRALLAGYTGRDQATVRAHVAELAAHGIAAPERVPTVYPVPGTRVCVADAISVHGLDTSGEGEFVMYRHGDRLLIGVASDHTDRGLEGYSIVKAKQCSDKPVGQTWWDYADLADGWDRIVLQADALIDGTWQPYQQGPLADMLTPADILAEVDRRAAPAAGDAVFSGTLPVIGGEFRPSEEFRVTLTDPATDRQISCRYRIDVLPELDS